MRFSIFISGILVGGIIFSAFSIVIAWTGPSSAPPNGNVSAPLNVGSTDQVKNAGLSVNALAVFGNAILSGTSLYFNFGTTPGSSGYGIRDNAGTMELKNSGGSWTSISGAIQSYFAAGSTNTINQIKFADGTTQTTAPVAGGISAVTTATCNASAGPCTVSCPATYFRTGCAVNNVNASAVPSGTNACACSSAGIGGTCYASCAR